MIKKKKKVARKSKIDIFLSKVFRKFTGLFYLKHELAIFGWDISNEKWFIDGKDPVKHVAKVDVEIREATIEDLEKYADLVPRKKLKIYEKWFNIGYECIIALKDDKIIYFQWLAFTDFYHNWLEMPIHVANDEGYTIDAYTSPEYKMKNLHLAVQSVTIKHFRDKNRFKFIATSTLKRYPGFFAMYKRCGFGTIYPIKSVKYERFFGFKRHTVDENFTGK